MGPAALRFFHSLARKNLTKNQGSGIITIPNRMTSESEASAMIQTIVDSGLPLEKFDQFIRSEDDILKYLNIIKNANKQKVIPADSPEGRRITEQLFGKRGDVVDMTGKKIDTRKNIMGGKNIPETEDEIRRRLIKQNEEGIASMKSKLEDPEKKAMGGRIGYKFGTGKKSVEGLIDLIRNKFGKKSITTADKAPIPPKTLERDMFKKADENFKNKRMLTDDEYQDFLDEVGGADQLEAYNFDGTVGDAKRIIKEQKQYMDDMELEYRKGNLDPVAGDKSPARKKFLEKKLEEMEASGDKRLMTPDEIEELSSFDLQAEMDVAKTLAPKMVERLELKKKYPGITDDLLDKILIDDNMQRKAEVLATIDEAFRMMEKGKSADEILDTMKNVTRTKQADGGRIGLVGGGITNLALRLARGFMKVTGRKPNPDELQKIIKEATEKDLENTISSVKTPDLMSKDEYAMNVGSGSKAIGRRMNEIDQEKLMKTIDEFNTPNVENKAKGGRIGLKGGADAATESFSKSAGSTRPGRKDPVGGFNLSGGQGPTFGGAPPTTGGGGGGNNNNPPPFSTNNTTPDTTFFNKTSKSGLMSNISPTILARLARMKKRLTPIIGEDIGLQYQNIDELNDILTNFRITQDLEDLIKTKKLEPELKYRKEIGDNTLIEGGINQAGDASIMFKKQFADGGRANFVGGGMGRRGFLKMLAGLGGGIAAAKTGLLKLAGKEPVKQVAKEVVKQSSGNYPPPYFFKLAEKIKFMGDDVTEKAATKDREIVTKYKDYEMSEDVATGEIVIKKRTEGSFNDQDGIISDEYIIYKPGMADETTKGKPPPEYEEFTVRPDSEGKLRDSEDGLDSINEILEEVGDPDSLTIKKAGGGIARMLGE